MTESQPSGFHSMSRLADARASLMERIEPHDRTESIPVEDAGSHVLAAGVDANRAVPHFQRAAMDGYAVQATDTHGASVQAPRSLQMADSVSAGSAVPVHTGELLPEGGNAVVMIEDCTERNGRLEVETAISAGENVSQIGEDVEAGERLFDAGRAIGPADIGLLVATGISNVRVRKRPQICIVPTGEELVESDPAPGEIVESNGQMIGEFVETWGGSARKVPIVTDDQDAIEDALLQETDNDVLVTVGGSSVGRRDLVADVVEEIGDLLIHGVASKPGHPAGIGVVEDTPVVLSPGYPVSTVVTAVQLLRPAIARAGGFDPPPIARREATLDRKIASEPGVRTFVRVATREDERGELRAEVIRTAGASVLSSVTKADGWVVVPEAVEGYVSGDRVSVERWRWSD